MCRTHASSPTVKRLLGFSARKSLVSSRSVPSSARSSSTPITPASFQTNATSAYSSLGGSMSSFTLRTVTMHTFTAGRMIVTWPLSQSPSRILASSAAAVSCRSVTSSPPLRNELHPGRGPSPSVGHAAKSGVSTQAHSQGKRGQDKNPAGPSSGPKESEGHRHVALAYRKGDSHGRSGRPGHRPGWNTPSPGRPEVPARPVAGDARGRGP